MLEKPKPKLSMIVPSIRIENLTKLHESISKSFSGIWEFIVIGPHKPEPIKNLTWIYSKASPTVCQQIGLLSSFGEYVCFGWDDGLYEPEAIDKMFTQIQDGVAISGRYIEGELAPDYMKSNEYYKISSHTRAKSDLLPDDFLLFNTGIVSRETLLKIGGFDCRFESTGISAVDLAIRMQLYGIKIVLSEDIVLRCSWLEGDTGDHAPVNAAVENDFNLLHKKYRQPIFHNRIIIDPENYKKQPKLWERRFGT